MKVAICTLGCKVNQYETQALEQELRHRGHTLTDFEETADIYVVNTCSVTAVSDKKSRQMLRQAKRRNPAAVIAACGCYAQTHPEDVKKLDLDVIAGTNDRSHFIDLLERAAREKTHIVNVDDVWERREFEVLPAGGMVNRTRAMLKVEDGCVNFCTYCLIPYARGRVRSLPMEEAAKQVRALREEGYREIVVTGTKFRPTAQTSRMAPRSSTFWSSSRARAARCAFASARSSRAPSRRDSARALQSSSTSARTSIFRCSRAATRP